MRFALCCFSLLLSLSALAKEAPKEPTLEGFSTGNSACPEAATYCFGIHLHMLVTDGAPAQSSDWIEEQLGHTNRLFAPISVGFYLQDVTALPSDKAEILTRQDRDLLGRKYFSRGGVHVFLVQKLADVDEEGKFLNGVHWRDRSDKSRRWIILASTAWSLTLAHEMGHFFNLPHSSYNDSLMNKKPRETPAPEDRYFVPQEEAIMKSNLKSMTKSKMLVSKKPKKSS